MRLVTKALPLMIALSAISMALAVQPAMPQDINKISMEQDLAKQVIREAVKIIRVVAIMGVMRLSMPRCMVDLQNDRPNKVCPIKHQPISQPTRLATLEMAVKMLAQMVSANNIQLR